MIITIQDDSGKVQAHKLNMDIANHLRAGKNIAVVIGEYDPSIPRFTRVEIRKLD